MNNRGVWDESEAKSRHVFDLGLCFGIADYISQNDTIVDIGCGNGAYVKALKKVGFDIIGFDGCLITPEITEGLCEVCDFSERADIGVYDVVLCLEVGEHIPAEYENIFIDNVCRATKKLLILSWAIEGQGGDGHVNCRNNDYIINKIEQEGLKYDKLMGDKLRGLAFHEWFKNTIMCFKK
jgi:SAM-dependent methyltransferase